MVDGSLAPPNTIPGARPVLRRRRLAPVPCLLRAKATNFMTDSYVRDSATRATPDLKNHSRMARVAHLPPSIRLKKVFLLGKQPHHRLTRCNSGNGFSHQRCD